MCTLIQRMDDLPVIGVIGMGQWMLFVLLFLEQKIFGLNEIFWPAKWLHLHVFKSAFTYVTSCSFLM